MPRLLSPARIQQARDLLAQGKPRKFVAMRLAISESTVDRIERGTYRCALTGETKRTYSRQMARELAHAERRSGLKYPRPNAPVKRCPTCGGLVQVPCFKCQLERLPKAPAAAEKALINGEAVAMTE